MLTLTTPLLTFAAPPFQDNPSKYQANQANPSKYQAAQLERYQTNFQERREKRQEANAPALPFQETLLLDNQYRPDQYQYRSTYRLVGEGGLVKVQRKKVAKKKLTDSNIRVATTSNNDVLPTQVLLGRVKVVVTEKPNLSEPRKREREPEENIWDELASFDRSQKREGSEPNLWRTEATDETKTLSPRGLHELQEMVNHNLRPRVYFLPS